MRIHPSILGHRLFFVTAHLLLCFFISLSGNSLAMAKEKKTQKDHMQSSSILKHYADNNTLERDDYEITVFNEKVWIAGGQGVEGVFSSNDLLSWKKESKHKDLLLIGHTLFSFNEKIWMIAGSGLSGFSNGVWSSRDGEKWQKNNEAPPFTARADHSVVVFKDKMWVMGGQGNELEQFSDVWSSKDGVHWNLETSQAAFGKRYSHSSVVFDGKIWVIGGVVDSEDSNEVWSSSDGKSWKLVTDSPGFTAINNVYQSAVFANKLWVATWGEEGVSLWSSNDGISWQELMPEEPLFTEVENLIVFNNALHVFVYGAIWKLE